MRDAGQDSQPVVSVQESPPAVDDASRKRDIQGMKQLRRAARKKADYPETAAGSCLASKARKLANRLTTGPRREYFNEAMAMIHGGAEAATVSGH